MKTFLSPLLAFTLPVAGGWAQSVHFAWTPATNQLIRSSSSLWQGNTAPLNYSTSYLCTSNGIDLDAAMLKPGVNYFAVQQISTNAGGRAAPTPFSGEVQVIRNPSVSLYILTSTNLGQGWSSPGLAPVIFPTTDQQRFWRLQIIPTNTLAFMQSTN